jgi:hypothetical protein
MTGSCSRRLTRTLVLLAACGAFALAPAGIASASNGPNYGHFNPLTGKPNSTAAEVPLSYGDFNPLSGRPNSAPQPTNAGAGDAPVGTVREPAGGSVQTVIKDHGSQTLALSLAAAAFLVALVGAGYVVIRTSGVQRPARTR